MEAFLKKNFKQWHPEFKADPIIKSLIQALKQTEDGDEIDNQIELMGYVNNLNQVTKSEDLKPTYDRLIEKLKQSESITEIIWDAPLQAFIDAKENIKIEIRLMGEPANVRRGIYACKKCKSEETITTQVQTRSADEQLSEFSQCLACGTHF